MRYLRFFKGAVDPNFILSDDPVRPHRASSPGQLNSEKSGYSPDKLVTLISKPHLYRACRRLSEEIIWNSQTLPKSSKS
ncbi:hypothetical protein TNCV_3763051 [Trichonephila clavipes]|uniref:Uncharacterized protein n=1 Tax=Trichonephila clavipes TaxID=2585209 RepID=A0A8X6VVA9_TRICX|nr:hypothetical protein TNCV_3763051 [Trichonephila clavipes]